MRVLNLWQKNGVFKIEVIQPLLDMAAGSSSGGVPFVGTDGPGRFYQVYYCNVSCQVELGSIGHSSSNTRAFFVSPSGSPPPFAKEPLTAVTANSTAPSAAQLQNSDALAAVAQLFQSTQGQQVCVCRKDCARSLSLHPCPNNLSFLLHYFLSCSRCCKTFSSSQLSQIANPNHPAIAFSPTA